MFGARKFARQKVNLLQSCRNKGSVTLENYLQTLKRAVAWRLMREMTKNNNMFIEKNQGRLSDNKGRCILPSAHHVLLVICFPSTSVYQHMWLGGILNMLN